MLGFQAAQLQHGIQAILTQAAQGFRCTLTHCDLAVLEFWTLNVKSSPKMPRICQVPWKERMGGLWGSQVLMLDSTSMCILLLLFLQYYVSLYVRYEKKWTILSTARVASHGVASGCPATVLVLKS